MSAVEEISNVRETFTPMITPTGKVVHLADNAAGWWSTICNTNSANLAETTADDPRPTCRVCAAPAAIDRHVGYLQYWAERKAAQKAERERHAAEREECQRSIDTSLALIKEYNRRADLRAGRDPNRPRRTEDERNAAELIALRAENDQLEAEVSGAWRTYD